MTKWIPELIDDKRAKYKALADAIERDVFSGVLNPGDKLPTHRDLADDLAINVSTVTRGYAEAERRGFISGTVGRGTFVAADAAVSSSMVSFEPHAPGMIELGMVNTFYDLDPDIQENMKRLTRCRNLDAFLRYTDPRGLPEHREIGAQWVKRYRLDVSAGDVLVCSGAQHGLACCLTALFRSGDRIATDCLTYPGMKTLAAMFGVRLVPVEMDHEGMIPEALDTICRREKISGLYLMPGVQNPTTACMSVDRRERIAMIASNHQLTIIEDDAYDLTIESDLPPVSFFARENSVHIAGVSKSLAVGLRVAFMSASKEIGEQLAHAILNTIWMTPPLNVELIRHWIRDGTADRVLVRKREAARNRFEAVKDDLDKLNFAGNPSGFFIWLELPDPWRGYMIESRAREAGVNIFGAEKFAVGDSVVQPMARLSLSGPKNIEELRKGLSILYDILNT
ncbi:PLP-dependent aminotransferase family protein [Maridesulfovibrio hydrothermalis]|uniref:Transcriptional regulator, GntR family with aminotransferase domain n=1 Tax=Maridesulfovibrio hydrothermalis AM13 = DSM 14728 TaxID=1121451 RepID=L0RA52_9BACT|nr:PLP-dependent aminotransferase family protein [Maridesulfovibrio hydrothermalis]CCO23097.1 Transcriptional regulator, GntR family with aminotransferase domain [Maridesulfovibrio hydrothermalis AM13 = DSM 14728]